MVGRRWGNEVLPPVLAVSMPPEPDFAERASPPQPERVPHDSYGVQGDCTHTEGHEGYGGVRLGEFYFRFQLRRTAL